MPQPSMDLGIPKKEKALKNVSKSIKKEPFLVLIASFLTYLFTDSNKCFSYTFILQSRESRDKGIQMGIQALMEWTILYI